MNIDYRNNINDKFNLKNLTICKKLLNLNKTEFVNKGKQGEIFKVSSNDCGSVIVKKKLIRKEDKKWKNNEQWMKDELEIEYKIMLITNRMINNSICPNFIKVYDFNKDIPLIIMEYADGDCKFLFKNEYFEKMLYKSFLFQVCMSIYCFNNYTMLYHRDVKPENILYKKINKNLIFHYKMNNKNYYVPTYGYLFMLCDYGASKFKLDGRETDINNFNYNIIKHIIQLYTTDDITLEYKHIITEIKNTEEFTKKIFDDKNITKLIHFIKNIKNQKINNFVYEIYEILTYSNDITEIFTKYFLDFTVNNYKDDDIILFNVSF
jgi:serine/threonine protein kinase